ncbi:MAG: hypothetical protein AAFN80_14815 [Pseudomonadota bacterium]
MTMPAQPPVSSPQFRTALIRKLKNLFPNYQPEFLEAKQGVSFVMKDNRGRTCSRPVQIYRNTGNCLQTEKLKQQLTGAQFLRMPPFDE